MPGAVHLFNVPNVQDTEPFPVLQHFTEAPAIKKIAGASVKSLRVCIAEIYES